MSALPRSTDVFVVGGGPAGLAAAIAARRLGLEVMLADSCTPPVDKACGEGIMPDGLAAARALGLVLDTAPGFAFRGIRFCDGEAAVQASFPSGSGRGVRRVVLHQIMVDQAGEAGVRLRWGSRIGGISPEGVLLDDRLIRARWIIGADGSQSNVRRWAGLDACHRDSRRFGFRRHFRIEPATEFMELHWSDGCQLYVTPVGPQEICVVLICRNPHLRLEDALPLFPQLQHRLSGVQATTSERGSVTATRRLKRMCSGNVALVGDASGSVDAITGEGLCLLFQQAATLAGAIAAEDLSLYQAAHGRAARRPELMGDLMLLLDGRRRLRRRAIRAMADRPSIFARMLAAHTGDLAFPDLLTSGLALGWRMLCI
jgi:flavin-dependent dehydrogenase